MVLKCVKFQSCEKENAPDCLLGAEMYCCSSVFLQQGGYTPVYTHTHNIKQDVGVDSMLASVIEPCRVLTRSVCVDMKLLIGRR